MISKNYRWLLVGLLVIACVALTVAFSPIGQSLFRTPDSSPPSRAETLEVLRKYGASIIFAGDNEERIDTITFTQNRATPAVLKRLLHVGPIRKLDFDAAPGIDDDCLLVISRLKDLEELNLGGTDISDHGMAYLSSLKNLRSLYLWRTNITEAGIESASLSSLETINLWDTDTSDKLVVDVLPTMKNLRQVYLGASPNPNSVFVDGWERPKPKIASKVVDQYRRSNPNIEVTFWSGEEFVEAPKMLMPATEENIGKYSVDRVANAKLEETLKPLAVDDWPSFLGPNRNGVATTSGRILRTDWSQQTPRLVWSLKSGEGLSAPAVAYGRLVFTGRDGDREFVRSVELDTGDLIWEASYETNYVDALGYSNGPRSSPVIDDDRLYVCSAFGLLQCIDLASGKRIWHCDTLDQFHVTPNMYGVGSTPVVFNDLVLVVVGGSSETDNGETPAGIVAFDKKTGEVRYTLSDTFASYSSIQVAETGGTHIGFALMREGLVAFDVPTGRERSFLPWAAKVSGCVNAATPIVDGKRIFISEAYGPGSVLLELTGDEFKVLWRDPKRGRKRVFRAHWSTPILKDGFVYGCSGRHSPEGTMKCVELETGKVAWESLQRCLSSACLIDEHLVNVTDDGSIELIRATPEKYDRVARFKPNIEGDHAQASDELLLKYPAWAGPIVAGGYLIVRGRDKLAAFAIFDQQ